MISTGIFKSISKRNKFRWKIALVVLSGVWMSQNASASQCFGCYSDSSSSEETYIAYIPKYGNEPTHGIPVVPYAICTVPHQEITIRESMDPRNPIKIEKSEIISNETKFPSTAEQILK